MNEKLNLYRQINWKLHLEQIGLICAWERPHNKMFGREVSPHFLLLSEFALANNITQTKHFLFKWK